MSLLSNGKKLAKLGFWIMVGALVGWQIIGITLICAAAIKFGSGRMYLNTEYIQPQYIRAHPEVLTFFVASLVSGIISLYGVLPK